MIELRQVLRDRCKSAWIDHWNNEHVKRDKEWGGMCCIDMAIDAVFGIYKPGTHPYPS